MPHHAYIYEGPLERLQTLAADARRRHTLDGEHSPDVHVRQFEKFGIDESRWLIETAALRSSSGQALFVLGVASMTGEAQQALLKLFEEPQPGIVFVLLLPYGAVLPTLRSRTLPYPVTEDSPLYYRTESSVEAENFLKASAKERSVQIAALLKDEDYIKERVRALLQGLEEELAPRIADVRVREALEDIQKVRSYVGDRSAALKMLLEHLAIALPQV